MADIELIKPRELPAITNAQPTDAVMLDNGVTVGKVTPEQLVNAGAAVASEAEALAGVNNTKRMTPLRVRQVLDNVNNPAVLRAHAWAESTTPPDPLLPDSKSAKTWANEAERLGAEQADRAEAAARIAEDVIGGPGALQVFVDEAEGWASVADAAAVAASASAARVDLGALDSAVDATAADRVQTGLDRAAATNQAALAAAEKAAAEAARIAAQAAADASIQAGQWDQEVADEAARLALTGLATNWQVYQLDTEHVWRWDGSAWVDRGESPLALKLNKTDPIAGYVLASNFIKADPEGADCHAQLQAGANLAAALGLTYFIDRPWDFHLSDTLICDRLEMMQGARLVAGDNFYSTATPIDTIMRGEASNFTRGIFYALLAPTSARGGEDAPWVKGVYWKNIQAAGNTAGQDKRYNYANMLCIRCEEVVVIEPNTYDAHLGITETGNPSSSGFALNFSQCLNARTYGGVVADGLYESLSIRQGVRNIHFFGVTARDGGQHACQYTATSRYPRLEEENFPRPDSPNYDSGGIEVHFHNCIFERTKAIASANGLALHTGRRVMMNGCEFINSRLAVFDYIQDLNCTGCKSVWRDNFGDVPEFAIRLTDIGEPWIEKMSIIGWDIFVQNGIALTTALSIGSVKVFDLLVSGLRARRDNLDVNGGPRDPGELMRLLRVSTGAEIFEAQFTDCLGDTVLVDPGAVVHSMGIRGGHLRGTPTSAGTINIDAATIGELVVQDMQDIGGLRGLNVTSGGSIGHLIMLNNKMSVTNGIRVQGTATIGEVTLQGNRQPNGTVGFGVAGASGVVSGNELPAGATIANRLGSPNNLIIRDNRNYRTENSGISTIATGETFVSITHGIDRPGLTAADFIITPMAALGGAQFWISSVTSSTFRINISATRPSDVNFAWRSDASLPRTA